MWDYQTNTESGSTIIYSYGYRGSSPPPKLWPDETFTVDKMMVGAPPPVVLALAALPIESPGVEPSAERRTRWWAWQQSQTRARRSRRRRARPVGFQARR